MDTGTNTEEAKGRELAGKPSEDSAQGKTREKVAIKKAIEPDIKQQIKEKKDKLAADSSSDSLGETRERVAEFVDISHDTLSKLEERVLQFIYHPML